MSASNIEINNIAVDANAPADNKKPRKPSLPAKFGKFIQFAYYLCNNINASNPGAIDKERFLESIQLFAAVDAQQAFVQGFFDNAKGVNAEIRTILTARTRAAAKAAKDALKTPKIKKTKNIATTDSTTNNDATTDAPAKKTKKTKKPPVVNDFVNDIVQLALGNSNEEHTNATNENVVLEIVHDEPTPTPMIGGGGGGGGEISTHAPTHAPTDSNAKPVKQPKTAKQPKAKTEQNATPATATATATAETANADYNAKPVKEPKTKTPKEPKAPKEPKTPKEPKSKTPKVPKPTATPVLSDNDDDDDAELEVEPFSLNGVDFLLDDRNNNLYHPTSHLLVGQLSLDKLSII